MRMSPCLINQIRAVLAPCLRQRADASLLFPSFSIALPTLPPYLYQGGAPPPHHPTLPHTSSNKSSASKYILMEVSLSYSSRALAPRPRASPPEISVE